MLLLVLLLPACWAVEVRRPRGVSLTNHHFYDESKPFTCLDGSVTIPFDQVNDDYCDCKDGSDEPGTAACPNSSFHCTNTGYKPQYISSRWVNDGVCDCCDGTDEYNSGTVCENSCREKGRKERETLLQIAEVTREGFRLKKILIEDWKKAREEKQQKLTELQTGKKSLEGQVEMLRTAKEEAEKPEKEAKDRHQKLWEEQQAALKAQREQELAASAFQELDDNMDGVVSVAELQTHPELDTDGDGVLSEGEAQTLLGGDAQMDPASFHDRVWAAIRDKYSSEALPTDPPAPSVPEPTEPKEEQPPGPSQPEEEEEEEEEPEGEPEEEEEEEEEEDFQVQGEQPKEAPPPLTPPQPASPTEDKMPPYDEQTQALIDAAQEARTKFEEAERSLKDMEEAIKNLEQEISFDFGPEGEFAYLYKQCYELTTNEYIYRLCPFKHVSQQPKHGGGSPTSLGTWGSWAGPEHDKFSSMKYEQGTGCWQGPSRSTTVRLLCGKETTVTSTTEPSRCEYLMELTTPAACQEPPPEPPADGDHDEL
ncbi:glucosidase 2 subunit beta isoform X1 [Pipistrellus kuhlii]|uniref:Glucosidase 2 subunit beta n=2 Tax=Pipistrellus kuhlii TaxID=59472 RepID=A0A7J7TAE5_PIPKU|nr:glucosidase 2 subunit beta isoform X1 [Pipistrellus kuhlii]XP_045445221.1 glucosidase 2 subunit beta isoform X1 [Pipistrellus kuhlii]XP_045445222.1 glucosidase 2 subunit beta isoform X1 [Pipistrellus kuhlii]XP_045445223.1 glucosidase 2 subunit beta isoform X1 [Pipistrellus kuhlii]KAF6297686.1 protein kinase C substrate 80K-H [Pipistrellus kuhlii]